MRYDPTFYDGAAGHYRRGRPAYSPRLEALLAEELSLLFGDRAGEFADEVRELLRRRSSDGVFWDWPGDTEVMLARK